MKHQEFDLQCEIVKNLEKLKDQGKVDFFSAIPNETFTTSWNQKRKNKMAGVRSGLCDLFILIKGVTYFLELKTPTGTLQPSQKEVLSLLNQNGVLKGFVCTSLEEFDLLIDDLISQRESKDLKYLQANLKGARLFNKYCLTKIKN